jgi:hypothetical protein
VVVVNVCPAAVIPFNVYNPLLPHVALPYASEVNTAFDVIVPPVTFIVFVTSEVVVKVPVLIEVDDIFPEAVKDVAVINPVLSEVDEIFPDDTKDVAVIAPVFNEVDEIFPDDVKDVAVIAPVLSEVDEIFPEDVNEVAVIAPVFNEVEEIFPDDTNDVAVINPAAKPPLPSRLTIVFAVLEDVAEVIADENVL